MVEVIQILLVNTGVSFMTSLLLLLFFKRKNLKSKDARVYLSKDMLKIKEEIIED